MRNLKSIEWTELRNKCYERDNFTCRKCKKIYKIGKLHAHHILPFRLGGKDELINLISLCNTCHIKIENQYRRVGMTRYLRDYIKENIETEERLNAKNYPFPIVAKRIKTK